MTNKEKKNAAAKKYYEANKEKKNAATKKYREANKEKIVALNKKHREANKKKLYDQQRAWRKANPDKVAEHNRRHLLKLNLANRKISWRALDAWAAQVKEKTPFCEWCYSEDNLEAHHIMPKAKYPQYALDINNGRTMCQNCHKNCHIQGGY